jgi:hypothetical protein
MTLIEFFKDSSHKRRKPARFLKPRRFIYTVELIVMSLTGLTYYLKINITPNGQYP